MLCPIKNVLTVFLQLIHMPITLESSDCRCLKPHCPTCSYLLPLYIILPQSVHFGSP